MYLQMKNAGFSFDKARNELKTHVKNCISFSITIIFCINKCK